MKIYIIQRRESSEYYDKEKEAWTLPDDDDYRFGLTDSYHDGGGMVIVGRDDEEALRLIEEYNKEHGWGGRDRIKNKSLDGATVYEVGDEEPRLWLFPDEGCC